MTVPGIKTNIQYILNRRKNKAENVPERTDSKKLNFPHFPNWHIAFVKLKI